MKLKPLILLAMTAVPAWAVHAAGPDLLSVAVEGQSGAMLWVGLGLMAAIALRRYR